MQSWSLRIANSNIWTSLIQKHVLFIANSLFQGFSLLIIYLTVSVSRHYRTLLLGMTDCTAVANILYQWYIMIILYTYIKILSCIIAWLLMYTDTVLLQMINAVLLELTYILVLNIIVLNENSTYLLLLTIFYIVLRRDVSSLVLCSGSTCWWWVVNIANWNLLPSILSDSKF